MGVNVHRQVKALAKGAHQRGTGRWAKEPRHVLNREDVCARCNNLLCQPQVVVEGVLGFGRVEQVSGVAEGNLGKGLICLEYGVDCRAHLFDVVEGVKNSEDVHAG